MTGLGILMLREKLSLTLVVSLLLGLVGTLMVSTSELAQIPLSRSLLLGNFVILLAGLGSAFYNTYSKHLLAQYSELQVLIYSYVAGAASCAGISASNCLPCLYGDTSALKSEMVESGVGAELLLRDGGARSRR